MNQSDDLYDENLSLVMGPMWFVVARGAEQTATTSGGGLVTGIGSKRRKHVPLFTDHDLAERFAGCLEGEYSLVVLMTPASVKDFLGVLQRIGCRYVSIDPGDTFARVVPIQRVLDGIAEEHG